MPGNLYLSYAISIRILVVNFPLRVGVVTSNNCIAVVKCSVYFYVTILHSDA